MKQAHVAAGVRVPKGSRRQRWHDVPIDDDAVHLDAARPDELVAERLVVKTVGS